MSQLLDMKEDELKAARKSDWRKRLMGHEVRKRTTVTLRWVSERLGMGSEGHVSRISLNMADLERHPEAVSTMKKWRRNARR